MDSSTPASAPPRYPWSAAGAQGEWAVRGTTPEGKSYEGSLSLVKCGGVFWAKWTSPQLGDLLGTGVLHDGLLLVARGQVDPRPGIVWYTLASSGDLEAVWNSPAINDALATGRAVAGEPGMCLTGVREVTYFDPNGTPLDPLSLRVQQPSGESLFSVDWHNPDPQKPDFTGVGLPIRNGLVAAWYEQRDELALDVLVFTPESGDPGREAQATWASLGGTGMGSETITRNAISRGMPGAS